MRILILGDFYICRVRRFSSILLKKALRGVLTARVKLSDRGGVVFSCGRGNQGGLEGRRSVSVYGNQGQHLWVPQFWAGAGLIT